MILVCIALAHMVFAYLAAGHSRGYALLVSGVPFLLAGVLFLLAWRRARADTHNLEKEGGQRTWEKTTWVP